MALLLLLCKSLQGSRIEKHNNSYLCIAYEKHSLLLYSF